MRTSSILTLFTVSSLVLAAGGCRGDGYDFGGGQIRANLIDRFNVTPFDSGCRRRFATAASRFGEQAVMGTCACLSIVGTVLTLTCVPEHLEADSLEDDVSRKPEIPMKVVVSEPSLIDYFQTA